MSLSSRVWLWGAVDIRQYKHFLCGWVRPRQHALLVNAAERLRTTQQESISDSFSSSSKHCCHCDTHSATYSNMYFQMASFSIVFNNIRNTADSQHTDIIHYRQEYSESASLRQSQNFNQKRSGTRIRIFGLIRVWMSIGSIPKCCGCIILSASVISPSTVLIGRWLYEKFWQMSKSLLFYNEKVIRNPHTNPNRHQKSVTSRGRSPLDHVWQVWSMSVSAFVSYPVYRMTDRTIT